MPNLRFLMGLRCGEEVFGDGSDLRFRGPTGAILNDTVALCIEPGWILKFAAVNWGGWCSVNVKFG